MKAKYIKKDKTLSYAEKNGKEKDMKNYSLFLKHKVQICRSFHRRHLLLQYSEKCKCFMYVNNMQVATDVGESGPVAA